MPRSRVNGNFIDKTSSIVANILLQIIPTASGEKRHLLIIEMGCWLNPKEIMQKLCKIIMKLRD
uniref:Uncharacterized protein n=1 Tax=Aegilops tauschii subsp. strangulata TaxID=200361 RepID=A0A452Y9X3_AEGTS